MFRSMRRHGQQLPEVECRAILERGSSGVLAVLGDEDYPYAVPLSYVCCGDTLYFHCAKAGHKLDAIRRHDKASFCVIDQDQVVPAEYTTYFRSVIAFGRVREVTEAEGFRRAICLLADKYAPQEGDARRDGAIEKEMPALCMLALEIEHLTGKEAIELKRSR